MAVQLFKSSTAPKTRRVQEARVQGTWQPTNCPTILRRERRVHQRVKEMESHQGHDAQGGPKLRHHLAFRETGYIYTYAEQEAMHAQKLHYSWGSGNLEMWESGI